MKLGWPTTRTIVWTGGLISRTVGGSETLVKLILGSAPQPDSREGGQEPEQ